MRGEGVDVDVEVGVGDVDEVKSPPNPRLGVLAFRVSGRRPATTISPVPHGALAAC